MRKRISLNLIGQLCTFVCSLCISFFLTPYIVANLGQETYGFVGLANNFTSYITLFTVALNGMLSRYVTVEYTRRDFEKASGYLSTAIITQMILALILLIPMMVLAGKIDSFVNISPDIIPDVRILWILMFLSFLMNLAVSGLGIATFAKNRLDISSMISIITTLLRAGILIIAFCFFTPHVWYMGLASIACNILWIICSGLTKVKLMPEVKISRKYFSVRYIYNLLIVGVWNSLNKLQQILYTGLDLLLTNLFISGTEMGLLSVAKTVPSLISSLINTVSGTFDPTMTIAYSHGDMKDFIKQTKMAMKLSGFLCSVPILGFICFGIDFYTLWMPSLSDVEVRKVHILAVLTLLPQVFSVYIYPLYTVNTITCKLKVPVLLSIGIGVMNISIVYILLKTTNLGVYVVAGVSSILWVCRIFLFVPVYAAWNIKVNWKTFYYPLLRGCINIVVIGTTFAIISKLTRIDNWLNMIVVCGTAGLIGYCICYFVMFNEMERKKVMSIFQSKIYGKGKKQ